MKITKEWLEAKLKYLEVSGLDEFELNPTPPGAIRAKMSVGYVNAVYGNVSINAGCVYSQDPNSENRKFSDATPSGNLSLQIQQDKPAARFLQQGDDIYVDISIAQRNPWRYIKDIHASDGIRVLLVDDPENVTVQRELTFRVNKRENQRPTYADLLDDDGNVVVGIHPMQEDHPFKYYRYVNK